MGDVGDTIDPNRLQYELTRTDHGELSYTADRNIIRSHIEELRSLQDYKGLKIYKSKHVYVDPSTGTLQEPLLIYLHGLIRYQYKSRSKPSDSPKTYNAEVRIWIPESYPYTPPKIIILSQKTTIFSATATYLVRERDVNNNNNKTIIVTGDVITDYMKRWRYPGCTLTLAVRDLCREFSRDPPLRETTAKSQQQQERRTSPFSNIPANNNNNNNNSSKGVGNNNNNNNNAQSHPLPFYLSADLVNPIAAQHQQQQGSGLSTSTTGSSSTAGQLWGYVGGGGSSTEYHNQQHPPPSSHTSSGGNSGVVVGGSGMMNMNTSGYNNNQQQQQQQQQQQYQQNYQQQPQKPPSVTPEQLQDEFRQVAIATLSERLKASLEAVRVDKQAVIDRYAALRTELMNHDVVISAALTSLQTERTGIDTASLEIQEASKKLDAWLAINEPKAAATISDSSTNGGGGGDSSNSGMMMNVDSIIVPTDELSAAVLLTMCEDTALEEMLETLREASRMKVLSMDSYLDVVRDLSRKQFKARYLLQKVLALQQQQGRPVSSPPAQSGRFSLFGRQL